MKYYFLWALFPLLLISCYNKNNECMELADHIEVIYCTPVNTEECLPLEIANTPTGWEAHYGKNKEGIKLEPQLKVNEEGDSLYYFHEVVKGEISGTYEFNANLLNTFFSVSASYKDASGNVKSEFRALVLRKEINNGKWKDLECVEIYEDNIKDYGEPNCATMRDVYEFHQPKVCFDRIDGDATILSSNDENVFLYWRWYELTGQGPGGAADYLTMLRYNGGNGYNVIDECFDNIWYPILEQNEFNFLYLEDVKLTQIKIRKKTFYLVELTLEDVKPLNFEGSQQYDKRYVVYLSAHQIKNNKFVPAKIFNGVSFLGAFADKCKVPMHFKFDENNRTLKIPVIDTRDYSFSGKYSEIKL